MVLVYVYNETLASPASGGISQMWPAGKVADIQQTRASYIVGMGNGYYTGAPVNITIPALDKLTGTMATVVTCNTGSWSGAVPIAYTYQWKKDGVNIGGATSAAFTIPGAYTGSVLTCLVTATNGVGNASQLSRNSCTVT